MMHMGLSARASFSRQGRVPMCLISSSCAKQKTENYIEQIIWSTKWRFTTVSADNKLPVLICCCLSPSSPRSKVYWGRRASPADSQTDSKSWYSRVWCERTPGRWVCWRTDPDGPGCINAALKYFKINTPDFSLLVKINITTSFGDNTPGGFPRQTTHYDWDQEIPLQESVSMGKKDQEKHNFYNKQGTGIYFI